MAQQGQWAGHPGIEHTLNECRDTLTTSSKAPSPLVRSATILGFYAEDGKDLGMKLKDLTGEDLARELPLDDMLTRKG